MRTKTVPRINQRGALAIWVTPCLLLIGMVRIGAPLLLLLVLPEDPKQLIFLYGGKKLEFSPVPWRENLIGVRGGWVFKKKKMVREGKYFGIE